MPTLFSLVIENGPNPGQRTLLVQDTFIIGRDPSSDLHIQDIEISRRHARLIAQSGGHGLEDLGSTNGTFVNGERIRVITVLRPGDSVRLGETVTLRYEMDAAGLEATPPSTQQLRAARPPAPRPALRPTASLQSFDEPPAASPPARVPAAPPSPSVPPAPVPSASPRSAARSAAVPASPARTAAPVIPQEPQEGEHTPPPRRHPRRRGPVIERKWMIGCGALALIGLCLTTAFLWYVDANFLWCDVFGSVIAACR